MGQMIVRAIPDEILANFKQRAKDEGLSAEALIRRMIVQKSLEQPRMSHEEALRRLAELRAMTPTGFDIDTTALLREFRDKGYEDD